MYKISLIIAISAIFASSLLAQNNPATKLAGYWKMYNSAWDMDNKNYLLVTPQEDGKFNARYLINGEIVELQGIFFGEKQLSINEVSANSSKNIYNGEVEGNGNIEGYYASKSETLGRFTWIKICDATGKAFNSYDLPCVENIVTSEVPTNYETITTIVSEPVKSTTTKIIQKREVIEYVGEARNPNIPLAETTTGEIPANAIFVGHIGLDSIVTYRTEEVEIPVEASVESKKIVTTKKTNAASNNSNKAYASKKVMSESAKEKQKAVAATNANKIGEITDVLTSRGVENVPAAYEFHDNSKIGSKNNKEVLAGSKFGTCDPGNANTTQVINSMERGTTIEENGHVYHIVGKGETMSAISRLYNIPIMQLAENNKKECERIIIGEKLIIK